MEGSDKVVAGLSAKMPLMAGRAAGLLGLPVGGSARREEVVWEAGFRLRVDAWDEIVEVSRGRVYVLPSTMMLLKPTETTCSEVEVWLLGEELSATVLVPEIVVVGPVSTATILLLILTSCFSLIVVWAPGRRVILPMTTPPLGA